MKNAIVKKTMIVLTLAASAGCASLDSNNAAKVRVYYAMNNDIPELLDNDVIRHARKADEMRHDIVELYGSYKNGLLYWCADSGSYKCAKRLLDLGANPMLQLQPPGRTMFQDIYDGKHYDMVNLFLSYTNNIPVFETEYDKAAYFMRKWILDENNTDVVYCNNEDLNVVRSENESRIRDECAKNGSSSQCMILATNDVSKLNVILLDAYGSGYERASIVPVKSFFILTDWEHVGHCF